MKPTKHRVVIVSLCFLLGVVSYLDRTAISFFAQPIMDTFALSHTMFGAIVSAFGLGYFFFTVIGGWLADLIGSRRLFGVTTIIWGICTGLIGVLPSFWSLLTARAFLGAAEGPLYPGLVRAFNDWLPSNERTKSVAYAIPVSVSVAVIIGGPLASLVFSVTGTWQSMFYLLGFLSLAMAVAWYAIFRDNPASSRKVNEQELRIIQDSASGGANARTVNKSISVAKLLRNPTLLSVYVAFFSLGFLFWFVLTWLPDFLQTAYHTSLASSALVTVFPWAAYAIGAIVAGHISDRADKTTGSSTVKKHLVWFSLLGAAVALTPLFIFDSFVVAVVCISLALGVVGMGVPPLWALNSDIVPQRPGLSSGIMDAAFALAGLLAPVLSGFLIDASGGYSTVLVLTSIVTAAGALLVITVANPKRASEYFSAMSNDHHVPAANPPVGG